MRGGSPLGGARQLERLDEAKHGVVARRATGKGIDLHRVGQVLVGPARFSGGMRGVGG
jgi:hypothetical protein